MRRRALYAAEPTDALLAEGPGRPPRPSRLDAVGCLWLAGLEDVDEVVGRLAPEVAHGYLVDEVVQWDGDRESPAGAAPPELTLFYFGRRRRDLDRAAFVARYRDGHGPLARQHHPGIWRYVQHFVVRAVTQGAPALDSVAELAFRTLEDHRERFYRDATSPGVIAADVAGFLDVERTWGLVTRKRILAD